MKINHNAKKWITYSSLSALLSWLALPVYEYGQSCINVLGENIVEWWRYDFLSLASTSLIINRGLQMYSMYIYLHVGSAAVSDSLGFTLLLLNLFHTSSITWVSASTSLWERNICWVTISLYRTVHTAVSWLIWSIILVQLEYMRFTAPTLNY